MTNSTFGMSGILSQSTTPSPEAGSKLEQISLVRNSSTFSSVALLLRACSTKVAANWQSSHTSPPTSVADSSGLDRSLLAVLRDPLVLRFLELHRWISSHTCSEVMFFTLAINSGMYWPRYCSHWTVRASVAPRILLSCFTWALGPAMR